MLKYSMYIDCPRNKHKQTLVFQAKPEKLWDENAHDMESTWLKCGKTVKTVKVSAFVMHLENVRHRKFYSCLLELHLLPKLSTAWSPEIVLNLDR